MDIEINNRRKKRINKSLIIDDDDCSLEIDRKPYKVG